jgi:hypothetical protein
VIVQSRFFAAIEIKAIKSKAIEFSAIELEIIDIIRLKDDSGELFSVRFLLWMRDMTSIVLLKLTLG